MTTLAVMPKPVEKPEKTRRRDRGDGGLFHVPGSKVWYTKVRGKKQSTGTRIKEEAKVILKDRKSTRLNSSHLGISYAVFCLKKKKKQTNTHENSTTRTQTSQEEGNV